MVVGSRILLIVARSLWQGFPIHKGLHMTTRESFEFVLGLLAQDTKKLERVMPFIQLVAKGDDRACGIIARISNGQISPEAAPDMLDGYLVQTLNNEHPSSLAGFSYLRE